MQQSQTRTWAAAAASISSFPCAAASYYFYVERAMTLPYSGTVVGAWGPSVPAASRYSRAAGNVTSASVSLLPNFGDSELIRRTPDVRAFVAGG
jgi:hypothetical protein